MRPSAFVVAFFFLIGFAFGQDLFKPNLRISVDPVTGRIKALDATRADAQVVLHDLLLAAHRRGEVDDQIAGSVTASIHDVDFEVGLTQVAELAHAVLVRKDGAYLVEAPVDILNTFKADGEEALSVIYRMMAMAGRSFSIDPSVTGLVTVDLNRFPFEAALQNVLRQVDATYRVEFGVYEIIPREPRPPQNPPLGPIDARSELERIVQVLHIQSQIEIGYGDQVDPGLRRLKPWAELGEILRLVGATYRLSGGVCIVYRDTPPNLAGLHEIRPEYVDSSESSKVVLPYIALEQADVREAIRMVMKWADLPYSIAPEVQGAVTLTLKRASLKTVLQVLLRQVDSTYRIRGGIYEFIPR